jgi:hypothetical protein
VRELPEGITVSAILGLVYPNENATLRVVDNKGFPRTVGGLYLDDMVEVTSEDQSMVVFYYLYFLNAPNQAPVASVTGPSDAVTGTASAYSASVTDDGLPAGSTLSYMWEITSGDAGTVNISAADQLSTDLTFSAAGDFELSFTASDGELSTVVVTPVSVTLGTGIDLADISSIKVYPNPANDRLFVDYSGLNISNARVRIIDLTGKVVYDESHYNRLTEIELGDLGQGIYFMNISSGDLSTVRKLSIVK